MLFFSSPFSFPSTHCWPCVEFCIYETTKRYSDWLRSICEYHSLWSFSFRRTIPLKIAVCWWKAREMSKVQNQKHVALLEISVRQKWIHFILFHFLFFYALSLFFFLFLSFNYKRSSTISILQSAKKSDLNDNFSSLAKFSWV